MNIKIKNFIIENFMDGEGSIEDDESLFEANIIDSLGVIKLLTFIENKFNVHIDIGDVTMDNFGTVNEIAELLKKKLTTITK